MSATRPTARLTAAELTTGDVNRIIAEIEALTPAQRRKLQLRLHATGLFVPEDLMTDKRKLAVATAVSPLPAAPAEAATPPAPRNADKPPPSATLVPARPATTGSGKVVVGGASPQPGAESSTPGATDSPHAMHPLPGQAPEQAVLIVFDGGSRGNPGEGYGSYQMRWPGSQPQTVRLRFGDRMTNNEAEYDTLIAALEAILKRLHDMKADPSTARLDIRGDSLLVINQVLGRWKCKEERMEKRRDTVRALLKQFGPWQLTHHDRENSVRALGH